MNRMWIVSLSFTNGLKHLKWILMAMLRKRFFLAVDAKDAEGFLDELIDYSFGVYYG